MTGRMETHRPAPPSSSSIVAVWSVSPEKKPLMASRQTWRAVTSPFAVGGRISVENRGEILLTGWSGLEFPPVSRTPEGWVRRTRSEAIPIPRGEPSRSLLCDRTND